MSDRSRSKEAEATVDDATTEVAVAEAPATAADEALEEGPPRGQTADGDAAPVDDPVEHDVRPERQEGEVTVVYRGIADVVEVEGRIFRPDQPVYVPSDVAENLLTLPFEAFELVEE